MAYPGDSPGAVTFPGVGIPPEVTEVDVPGLFAAPQGVHPRDALLVKFTPPTGKGGTITRVCPTDLQFDNTAPGGFGAMTCTIDWAEGDAPPDGLVVAAIAQVWDRRTGDIIWHGHVVDPGYLRTGAGASHQVACQGFHTVLQTSVLPLAYIDRDLGRWVDAKTFASGSAGIVDDISLTVQPDDWVDPSKSILQMDIPEGSKLDASTPTHLTMQYLAPKYGPVGDIVRVQGTHDGTNDADYRIKVRTVNDLGNVTTVMDRTYAATQHAFRLTQGAGSWTTTACRVLQLRWEWAGATDSAGAVRDYFLRWGNLAVIFQMVDRAGNDRAPLTSSITVGDIVDDVIGRMLATKLDISARIESPDDLVEQAAWFEGVSAADVFDFLEDITPDYYWAVWAPQLDRDEPRFEFRAWRGHPRYVLDQATKLTLAGGGDEIYNRAVVAFSAANDVPASVIVSGDVPELTAAGVTRTMQVDLTGEGPLTEATARRKGLAALASAGLQRTSGTAEVTAPVFDVREGRMIEPWEMRAGWSVVLTGGVLRADGGKAFSEVGARDGRSTFRVTGVSYSAATATATLDLDGGGRNLFNRVRRPLPVVRRRRKRRKVTRDQ